MSDLVPGECRSSGCTSRAEWYVLHERFLTRKGKRGPKPKRKQWDGEFCNEHLIRVLPLKLDDVRGATDKLTVERMVWEVQIS